MIILKSTYKIGKTLPMAILYLIVYLILANMFLKSVVFLKEYLKKSD